MRPRTSAVVMSFIFLGENITILKIVGGILILTSTYFAENKRLTRSVKENALEGPLH